MYHQKRIRKNEGEENYAYDCGEEIGREGSFAQIRLRLCGGRGFIRADGRRSGFSAGETKFIHTGIALEIPEGYAGFVYARSGLACKSGLAPANKVGVIDADYRGEVMVALHNHSNAERRIACGERIAQLVVAPFLKAEFEETHELSDTVRGAGGFGSTGKV